MTRRVLAVVALLLFFNITASSQGIDSYLALVREYAAGQGGDATARLSGWAPDRVAAAARVARTTAGSRDLVAAAMLHTDLANTIVDKPSNSSEFHIDMARALLGAASDQVGQRERVQAFTLRWFGFIIRMYTSCGLLQDAARHSGLGLIAFPRAATLYVDRGVIQEARLRISLMPDLRSGLPKDPLARERIESALKAPTSNYLLALGIDSHNAEARLRLGWVRVLLEDNRAKDDLLAAVKDARTDSVRYLAHLFLGGLAERENHLADALREYDSARAVGSGYQTPYVAMSRIEDALGHTDRARDLALIAVQLRKGDDDAWWDHRIGFDRDSLTWLREEARKP